MVENPVRAAHSLGQSIWLDNISRAALDSGELAVLIADLGIRGVTSNPSIFQKAIGNSDDYDAEIRTMLERDAYEIYDRLSLADIRRGLDMFLPTYEQSGRRDGFVSLEVSPSLAHDTAGTIAEADRLFRALGRPNAMIKIPATKAGIPAIEESIAAGINVNITLIFSVANYVEVARAFIRGLERRRAAGGDVSHVASVASFFLSRIDTMVDAALQEKLAAARGVDDARVVALERLLGSAAIGNARSAYARFHEIFDGPEFAALRNAGAQVQRPLWASTSTKNPAYPDTMYVDTLLGKHTVNTLPPATLSAFEDHGQAERETILDEARATEEKLEQLAEVGVDLEDVTQRLQDAGVASFAADFERLIRQVDAKRRALSLGDSAAVVAGACRQLSDSRFNERLAARDGSNWKEDAETRAKIEQRLGWLDVQETIDFGRLQAAQDAISANDHIQHVALLGMGGSSLAPEVLYRTFGRRAGFPEFHMLDSTNPDQIRALTERLDIGRTLFLVASKSGGTLETLSFFQHFYALTGESGGQFIAITDSGSQLEELARASDFHDVYLNPSDIGGRYSALSYFGMVPAALLGYDLAALRDAAVRAFVANDTSIPEVEHPSVGLGAAIAALAEQGRDKLSLFASEGLGSFGNWVEQLVAESLGKEGRGVLPVLSAAPASAASYGEDRFFVTLRLAGAPGNEELERGLAELRAAGHPCLTVTIQSREEITGEFLRWEYATAVAGRLLGINPFDEPNVAESKANTAALLDVFHKEGAIPSHPSQFEEGDVSLWAVGGEEGDALTDVLARQLDSSQAGDYFALLAYLPMSSDLAARLGGIRQRLEAHSKRAVTIGFGPRYLHSTGQLHKGGPNQGIFLFLTAENGADIVIPGREFGFATLHQAQYVGDMRSLHANGRRGLRLHGATAAAVCDALAAALASLGA